MNNGLFFIISSRSQIFIINNNVREYERFKISCINLFKKIIKMDSIKINALENYHPFATRSYQI